MDFFSFIPITAAIVNLFLGGFVLAQNPKAKLNIVYFFWALALAIWNGGTALAFFAKNDQEGLFAARILQFGVIGLPFLLFHVSSIICNRPSKRLIKFFYTILGICILSNALGFFVKEVRYVKEIGAYYSVGNYPFWIFAIMCTAASASAVVILHQSYRISSPLLRRRIQLVLFASYLIVLFGWNDILPIVGIYTYPLTNLQILPLGSAAAIFYGLIVGYSVLQNQLLDVRLSISRSTANMLRALQVTLVGFTLLIAISVIAPKNTFSGLSISLFGVILLVTGLIAAIVFPRLFGTGADRVERMILGDYYEYQERISTFVNSLPWYRRFSDLFEDLGTILIKTLGIANFKIVILDPSSNSFSVLGKETSTVSSAMDNMGGDSRILEKFKDEELEYLYFGDLDREEQLFCLNEVEKTFNFQNPDICFAFRANDEPFGLVFLTSKSNRDPYTKSDLELLARLIRNLGLVVNQIRLQEQIRAEQELDLLGRISKGLAHDLNNLLTPVATLLQVSSDTITGDPEFDDLVQISDRNVRTMKNYIRDSLFFSKTLKPQASVGKIDELVITALSTLSLRAREKHVSLHSETTQKINAVLDTVLFQRLVTNLVSNAIDASSEGSSVMVDIQSVRRRENEPDWLQLKVIDHGEGISPENLEKMKAAFFTTKDSGDGKRGFGLGLAICRKIVHLHGGTLNISSQVGKGTTVQVDLPGGSLPVLIAAEPLESATATAA